MNCALILALIALVIQGLLRIDKQIEKLMEVERERNRQLQKKQTCTPCNLADQQAVGRFSKLLQFPSVSFIGDEDQEPEKVKVFHSMIEFLHASYPKVFGAGGMELEMLGSGNLSMLLRWEGSDSSLNPILLVSHYDVVPVTDGTESDWTHPPFSGHVDKEGYIWGRGALDQKYSVASILEACSRMIESGRKPVRGLYVVFGHDEEKGGARGAKMVGAALVERGVVLDIVIDEVCLAITPPDLSTNLLIPF